MGVKFSPDLAYMIIQRSATDLEIHVVKNGGQSSVSVSSTLRYLRAPPAAACAEWLAAMRLKQRLDPNFGVPSVSSSKSEREILAGGWWWGGDPQKRSPLGSLLLATTTGVEMYKVGWASVGNAQQKEGKSHPRYG